MPMDHVAIRPQARGEGVRVGDVHSTDSSMIVNEVETIKVRACHRSGADPGIGKGWFFVSAACDFFFSRPLPG